LFKRLSITLLASFKCPDFLNLALCALTLSLEISPFVAGEPGLVTLGTTLAFFPEILVAKRFSYNIALCRTSTDLASIKLLTSCSVNPFLTAKLFIFCLSFGPLSGSVHSGSL